MIFLVVLCEGETEMDFVRIVLQPYLGYSRMLVHPILFGKQVKHDAAHFPGSSYLIFASNIQRQGAFQN